MAGLKLRLKTDTGVIAAALRRKDRRAQRALVAGLFQEGEGIMTQAKQLVPVDTGALRGSGFVELPKRTTEGINVEMGFGGPAAPYAVIVHEDLQAFHPTGQSKYLEVPFNAAKRGMAKRLARDIRRATRGR